MLCWFVDYVDLRKKSMNNTAAAFVAPRLDLAKIRNLRAANNLSIDDCIRRSSLGELWREIERGERKWLDAHLLVRVARPFGCDPAELLSPTCPVCDLPESIFVTDSDRRGASPEQIMSVRVKVNAAQAGKQRVVRIDYDDVSESEMEEFFAAVT
jgi:hypothetical protein